MFAKQSTAATLIVGPILDASGVEYASAVIGDLSISKNGGTLTAMASAATLTHIANGQYTLVTTTGNMDTLGRAQITCNKSTYQMPMLQLMVMPAMVFDSLIAGSDRFDANVTHISDTSQTARDIGASVLLSSGTGTGQLDFTSGVVKSNWVQILGTAITGTAAQLAAAITKFFNVATPTGTVNSLPDAVAGASGGVSIVGSNMGLNATALGDIEDLLATVSGTTGSPVVRSIDDTRAIKFTWPIATGTITVTRSINNEDPYVSASGAATFLHTIDGVHWWSLAYNAADRPTAEGTAVYRLVGSAGDVGSVGLRVAKLVDTATQDAIGFQTALAFGAIADPGTAAETYVATAFGNTYTVDYIGLDSTGTRTSQATRTKS